jgi:hypothetical protein
MARFPQNRGNKGSLKWIQRLINDHPYVLNSKILSALSKPQDTNIAWLSPLAEDEYAEYRDEAFLKRLGISLEKYPLPKFWPQRGPQWDALGKASTGEIVLVEAKSHVPELISHLDSKSPKSTKQILESLEETKDYLGSKSKNDWASPFYQYANRIAHLYLLRVLNGIPAYLLFVYFLNDKEMEGPENEAEWRSALKLVDSCLGIGRTKLSKYIIDVFVDVRDLKG